MKKQGQVKKFFENFILLMILVSLIQLFLEEYAIIKVLTIDWKNRIILLGLLMDLIFSFEFIVRTIAALKEKRFITYFFYQRGWIDFISSIPLLLLNSGPAALVIFQGNTVKKGVFVFLNIIRIIKAVRISRILRIVRILKIFGKIQNTESKMAQRHIATVTVIGVFSLLLCIIFSGFFILPDTNSLVQTRENDYSGKIEEIITNSELLNIPMEDYLKFSFYGDANIIFITYDSMTIIRNKPDYFIETHYSDDQYSVIKRGKITVEISLYDISVDKAKENLFYLLLIFVYVVSVVLIYSKTFAQTISDIIFIIFKGIKQKDYNLQVKIHKHYRDEEIYQFAQFYNEKYLPAKQKMNKKNTGTESKISFQDITKLKF